MLLVAEQQYRQAVLPGDSCVRSSSGKTCFSCGWQKKCINLPDNSARGFDRHFNVIL